MDNDSMIINCPACGKRMAKIYMPEQEVHLDICVDGCGGIYFDNRELNYFINPADDITPIIEAYKNKEYPHKDDNDLRVCPVCGMRMVKNFSSPSRTVQIDECYGCGGKFLDYSELEKIRKDVKMRQYDKKPELLPEKYYQNLAVMGLLDDKKPIKHIPVPEPDELFEIENDSQFETKTSKYIIVTDGEQDKKNFFNGALVGAILGVLFLTFGFDIYKPLYVIVKEYNRDISSAQMDMVFGVIICFILGILFGYINMKRKKNMIK